MRIRNLRIENFRNLSLFEMKDLGRINLIVGENNSGKTTILEALNLLMANGDTPPIWSMLTRRGESVGVERGPTNGRGRPIQIWRLFRGHDIQAGASFGILADTDTGVLEATAILAEYDPADRRFLGGELLPFDPSDEFLEPLVVRITWSDDVVVWIPIHGRDAISTTAIRHPARPGVHSFPLRFLTASSQTVEAVISLLNDIVLTPEEDLVTDALRIIEPRVQRIASSGSGGLEAGVSVSQRGGVLVRLEGIATRVPIGSLGDGIWRMLGLALNTVHSKGGILLVDDIDTGLHHTVMQDMWRFLYSAAKRYDVQVFATTHSRDCYESLAVICDESEDDDVTLQRIERGREKAVAYSEGHIIAAAKHDIEVR